MDTNKGIPSQHLLRWQTGFVGEGRLQTSIRDGWYCSCLVIKQRPCVRAVCVCPSHMSRTIQPADPPHTWEVRRWGSEDVHRVELGANLGSKFPGNDLAWSRGEADVNRMEASAARCSEFKTKAEGSTRQKSGGGGGTFKFLSKAACLLTKGYNVSRMVCGGPARNSRPMFNIFTAAPISQWAVQEVNTLLHNLRWQAGFEAAVRIFSKIKLRQRSIKYVH